MGVLKDIVYFFDSLRETCKTCRYKDVKLINKGKINPVTKEITGKKYKYSCKKWNIDLNDFKKCEDHRW